VCVFNCCLFDIADIWAFCWHGSLTHLSSKKIHHTTTLRSFLSKSTKEILQINNSTSTMRYPNLARIPRGGELTELIDVPELLSWELRKNPTYKKQNNPTRSPGIGLEECIVVPWVNELLRITSWWPTISRYNRDHGCKSAPHPKAITYYKDHLQAIVSTGTTKLVEVFQCTKLSNSQPQC
jgi:hypothetical protein